MSPDYERGALFHKLIYRNCYFFSPSPSPLALSSYLLIHLCCPCCVFPHSLFPVLPRRLCHLRPVRQALSPHVDVLLQRPAHLSHHSQLPHRGREPVHPAAPAIHPRGSPVPPRPLRLEQVRLPVRHRPRWVGRVDCFFFTPFWKLRKQLGVCFFMEAVPACVCELYFKGVFYLSDRTVISPRMWTKFSRDQNLNW